MELFEGCSIRYMSGVSYNRAINLSSQFPEVALLATARKRIVLPLVLPALAQSLSQATEAADHPPKKGILAASPSCPPLSVGRVASRRALQGTRPKRATRSGATAGLICPAVLFQRSLRLGALFVTACAHHEVRIFMSTKMSVCTNGWR